jgi:hypothetical protein
VRTHRQTLFRVAAVLLALSAVGSAAYIATLPNVTIPFLHAESFDFRTAPFSMVRSTFGMAGANTSALGTPTQPVLMASTNPPGNTLLVANDWIYTAVVGERALDSVPPGIYRMDLLVNGAQQGSVFIQKTGHDTNATSGATLSWDLGSQLPQSAVYLVRGTASTGQIVYYDLTLHAGSAGGSVFWFYRDANTTAHDPTIVIPRGYSIQVHFVNNDQATHSFVVSAISQSDSQAGTPVSPNADAFFTYTPAGPGSFVYRCPYHSEFVSGQWVGMVGNVTFSS